MTKEELRDIYFGFYDQLIEPERSRAKKNWDYDCAKKQSVPRTTRDAIGYGFKWDNTFPLQGQDYWWRISQFIEDYLVKDSEKEDLKRVYFSFYDQLRGSERSSAKINWDYEFCRGFDKPKDILEAISQGFDFQHTRYYWVNVMDKYRNKKQSKVMTREKQEAHFDAFVQKQREVLLRKGNDYSKGDEDRLSNFKLAGSICGLTPEQNCLSLIATKVARLGVLLGGKIPNNESIQDSVLDLANYSVLLDMIISEKKEKSADVLLEELKEIAQTNVMYGKI